MSTDPTPQPPASPDPAEPDASSDAELGDAPTPECPSARRWIRRFVAGDEEVESRAALRAHLASCGVCRDQYRAEVVLVAGLARGTQRSLESLERLRTRARTVVAGSARDRRASLAHLILPAFGLYALFQLAGQDTQRAHVRAVTGTVSVADTTLADDQTPRELKRGTVCVTDGSSRAHLDVGESSLTLEPGTALLFERAVPLRVRLFSGCLLVDGPAVVTSAAGVLESDAGSGTVRFDEHGFEVVSAVDGWRVSAASGTRCARAGEPLRLPDALAGAR